MGWSIKCDLKKAMTFNIYIKLLVFSQELRKLLKWWIKYVTSKYIHIYFEKLIMSIYLEWRDYKAYDWSI